MWFKNLQLYRFTRPFEHTADSLEKMLQSHLFTPCGNQDMSKFGWVSPLGRHAEVLVHEAQGQLLLCARKEEKMLPASVIKDTLQDKIDEMEAAQGRALKKKEKEALKEEILHTLLPRAFTRSSQTFLWINPTEKYLVVDAGSAKKADDVLSLLRKCTGSLPVVPFALQNPPEITMTEWLNDGAAPGGFVLEDEAELRSALEHGGIIRCKEQDLVTEEIKAHLLADKMAGVIHQVKGSSSQVDSAAHEIAISNDDLSSRTESQAASLEETAASMNQLSSTVKNNVDIARHADELMKEVTDATTGLRTERRISHVFIMDVPGHPETLFITDAAINIFPDLDSKRDIVQNAIDLWAGIGLGTPKVAILSAVETVTTKIPSTIEAAALCKMAERGQITGGLLDGPLAFDNAVSPEAARVKGIQSEVAGRADVLVVPDLESGNMLAKQLEYLGGADSAGIVMGARVPVVLTSRADSRQTRLASCAIALMLAQRYRVTPP